MSSAVSEVTTSAAAPLRPVRLGKLDVVLEKRADGVIHIRAAQPLGKYHRKLSDALEHWARATPERVFLAQRNSQGDWRKLSYAQVLSDVRRIGATLLRRGLSPDKPIVVLSGNDIEHALLGLAATYVGIPYAPISPAYSLMSNDFGKLRMIIELLTPGLVFVNDGGPFARALYATVTDEIELVVVRNPLGDRKTILFSDLLGAQDDAGVAAAHEAVTPDTIVVPVHVRFRPGAPRPSSTRIAWKLEPGDARPGFRLSVTDEPPVVVDWLLSHARQQPQLQADTWRLYIDEGNPTPPGAEDRAQFARDRSHHLFQCPEAMRHWSLTFVPMKPCAAIFSAG
jgi:feruloyl-CoA synthase